MKALLDTHAFLWAVTDDPRLSASARSLLEDPKNELYLSIASGWEMAIKASVGRLRLRDRLEVFLPEQMRRTRVLELPILMQHVIATAGLPLHHRDPFDRLLVVQAQMEKLPVVTADPLISHYAVDVVW